MGSGGSARPATVIAEASESEIRCWIEDLPAGDKIKLQQAMEEHEQTRKKADTSESDSTECPSRDSPEPQFSTNRELSFKDWGTLELPVVTPKSMQSTSPLLIIEPWEHVGYNQMKEPVRSSTNVAVLADRIGFNADCIPLWQEGSAFNLEELASLLVGKTLVFEGGHPSVYDSSSFTCECCPREFIYSVYKRVLIMRHQTGPGVFVCLSHQIAIAALVELVKDAVEALLKSSDSIAVGVAKEIQRVGRSVKIVKDEGNVVCTGYDHVNDKGWDQFATARNETSEGALLQLHPFDASAYRDRSDLGPCVDAQLNISVPDDEIKLQMKEDSDGFYLAMFHSDEVNAEAVMFANWALGQIASVAPNVSEDVSWLRRMPNAVEITACTKDEATKETVTEVAAMRIDYQVDGSRKSFYTCQFHPELDEHLRDSTHLAPQDGQDGERLLHSLLLGKHIEPNELGGYTPSRQMSSSL